MRNRPVPFGATLAKQLLDKLDGTMDPDIWITGDYYHKFVTWLMAQ